MINIPLLEKVLDHIKWDTEHWRQTFWRTDPGSTDEWGWGTERINGVSQVVQYPHHDTNQIKPTTCDTKFCFAGWAIELGPEPVRWVSGAVLAAEVDDDPADVEAFRLFVHNSETNMVTAGARAQRLLGLSVSQADNLFAATNTLSTIEHYINQLKKEELKS